MTRDRDLIYDLPVNLAEAYRGKPVKLRTADPGSIIDSLSAEELDRIVSIKIEDLDCGIEPLQKVGCAVPLELIVTDPAADFSKLYRFSALVESFPIRACIPMCSGFGKAVRVAAALHFAIKLEPGQPETSLIPEIVNILEFYLHSPGVTEPIEFFHSLLQARYRDQAISIWEVQEETPFMIRHVNAEGKESFPGRLAVFDILPADPAGHKDCISCSYLGSCGGYFKWPDRKYDCGGIKKVFAHIETAAEQLRADITAAEGTVP